MLRRAQVAMSAFGGDFRSSNLDLFISAIMALLVPFIAEQLFTATGRAIFGLILYYGICCILVVKWRKGTWDYRKPGRWPWIVFCLSLLLPLASAYTNLGQFPANNAPLYGVLLTLLIWVPLNAALEQISWFYIFDAWKNRWSGRVTRWIGW